MKIRISDMMDHMPDDSVPVRGEDAVSVGKIKERVAAGLRFASAERGGPRRVRRVLLIAAALALVLSLSAAGINRIISLAEMRGPDTHYGPTVSEVGLSGSPEYQASLEWNEYLRELYDSGKNEPAPGAEWDVYDEYGAHSLEARDTLDSLAERYGLRLHAETYTQVNSLEDLYAVTGVNGFMPETGGLGKFEEAGHYPLGGKVYGDGTLSFNASAALPGVSRVLYSFNSYAKGLFHRDPNPIVRDAGLEEWTYTTNDGTQVLLALGSYQSIMAAELEDCFIYVHIYSGSDNNGSGTDSADRSRGEPAVGRADLEDFAESFDFAAINALCL